MTDGTEAGVSVQRTPGGPEQRRLSQQTGTGCGVELESEGGRQAGHLMTVW